MEKRNKILVVLIIILSILIVGLGGYIVYEKVLKEDNNDVINNEDENNILVNYDEEKILELLTGKWLDCSEEKEDIRCNSITVSAEDNYFHIYVDNNDYEDDNYDADSRYVHTGEIIETKKDGNHFHLTIKETDEVEETQFNTDIKLDISKIGEKVIKFETVNDKINGNYYHAGSDYDEENKYIEEKKINIDSKTIKELESVFEFVYDYYDSPHTFCGETDGHSYFNGVHGNSDIGYSKSTQFKSYNELLDYLKKYMSENVICGEKYLSLSSLEKQYKEKDNNLYCIHDITKGGGYYQIEDIIISVSDINQNKISSKVEVKLSWDGISYEYYNVTYTKTNDNWIITSYETKD